uniref:C2 calcium dependent domain containing 6 n=1 Tax=Molossus molossus TaxID=27622 RepID=A0A7J8FQK6_MOLMO|nr:C2 calcium dependent domain containing 6 [Molossus molossus]
MSLTRLARGPGKNKGMLKKSLKGSEDQELRVTPETANVVPFGDVVGCLAIHIKSCRHFVSQINLQHYNNLYIRISINNIVKCTKMCSLLPQNTLYHSNEKKSIIKFDEVKYFSVQVPRRQDDVRNDIYLDLMQYDNKENQNLLLGRVHVHLYEVIQKGCFTEEFQMFNENTFICRVEVEFMFSYGNFGYGFSHQLKPLQKIVEPSMFMNIAPPPERTDPVTNIIIPQSIEYPAFLSPDLNVTVGMPTSAPQSSQPQVVRLEKLQQRPRERLEKMKKEYRDLHTWREKAMYLEGVLMHKLEHNELKESNSNEVLESQFEKKPEDTVTSDMSLINEEPESISNELMDNGDKKGLTLPTLNQMDCADLNAIASKTDESTKRRDTPLFTTPRRTLVEGNKILPLEEHQPEATTDGKLNNIHLQREVKLKDKHSSILNIDSSASESSFSTMNEYGNVPNCADKLMQLNNCGWLNTNKKGKSVVFLQKQYMVPPSRPEYIEVKPKYQNFNTKDGFAPFLKNIHNIMSVSKRNDQNMSKCRNVSSAEVIEYEDQDPPLLTHSRTPRPADETWPHGLDVSPVDTKTVNRKEKLAHNPDISAIKTSNTKNNLALDPSFTTIESLDIMNKLKERLPNVSLPNFGGESSLTGNVNVNSYRLSKSLSLTSHIENLKQSMVFKSVLSKNLQDLPDKLFSRPEIPMDTEAREKSQSSPFLSVHDKPPSSLEGKIFEKIQDLNSWLSKGDILNSKSLVNPIIKDIPGVSLSEDGPGNSPEVERELVSEKDLEAKKLLEIAFPMKKKSSFKKKHLESEVPSSKPGFDSITHDYIIKQIFTAPIFSKLEMEVEDSSEIQMNWQDQLPTAWESLSSNILVHYEENDNEIELPEARSVISQIIQAFPIDSLLESGVINVMELDKKYQKSSVLDTETAFAEEKPKDFTEDYSEIKSKTDSLSKQNIPMIPKETTSFFNRVEFVDKGQNTSPQDSKYQSTPDKKTDLPSNGQRLYREENDLSSILENFSNLLMGKFNGSDAIMLNSFFKNIFNVFLKYNQSEKRRQPEKELERLIQHPFPNNAEDLGEIKENFDDTDKLDRKPSLNPKLRVFLEALSESEIKNLKSELSKHIQHYLVEKLSESGHITKEDLPKIYQNLYLMNEKAEPKGQNVFLEKHSEIVKETMSFVNNFNHQFIDKHLEIRLRSFLNEILQNYFLKNLSECSLFKETEAEPVHSNISSQRTESASISFHELGQDISKGSFGRRLALNMNYPLNKSLQNCLVALSDNELLNLKADLSKYFQRCFVEKLSKSGLITEKQLQGISNHINLIQSRPTQLKCIKPDLTFRDENQFKEKHSEMQNKYSKIVHKTTLQKAPEDNVIETELTRMEEKEYFPLQNIKENPPIIREQKILTLMKVQPSSNKNTQAIPLQRSSERRTDTVLLKQRKEHGFTQLPQAENLYFETEIQDSQSWSDKSKIPQSNACFERTLKMKSLEKKEHNGIYKLTVQEKPEAVLSMYPRIPYCKMPHEDEELVNSFPFPSRPSNTLTHFSSEAGENSKLDQFCQRTQGYNNNNKKQHLGTFAHYKREIQALYVKPSEICNKKRAGFLESQSFKHQVVETEKNSRLFLFPDVLKRENPKPKLEKERNHVNNQKKSLKIVKVPPATPPPTRMLRKSVPRTLCHWTARRTIHDCSDRFEDLPLTSFHHLEKVKSRASLLEKSPDASHYHLKHSTRPNTAPDINKRRESYIGKCTSSRRVSSRLNSFK